MAKIKETYTEYKKELKKVKWPDKPTVMETSVVVTICTLIFAAYLWLIDLGLGQLFSALLYK